MRYRYVRATPGHLASGRPLAYGDVVRLSASAAERNRRLIDSGALLRLPRRRQTTISTEENAS